MLIEPPYRDTIVELLHHTPSGKSPGLDGIPFEVYRFLINNDEHNDFGDMLGSVLHDAFNSIFPNSWCQTKIVLLFKKGDPMLLQDWRPLSLINSDAKLFTKLLANRINLLLPELINPYQTGFTKSFNF